MTDSDSSYISGDILASCLESIAPEVLQAFEKFVKGLPDQKWLVVSDYHRENSDFYSSDAFVFTVLPAEQNFLTLDAVNAGLPCKLSSSKVRQDILKFLRELTHFTFAFTVDKGLRPFGKTKDDMERGIEASIRQMKGWTNASDCQSLIRATEKLRGRNYNLKTINHAILAANLAAAISGLIAKHKAVKIIGWASDRDAIVDDLNRVVDTIFGVSLHAFLLQRNLPEIPKVFVFGDPAKSKSPMHFQSDTKMPPLFYSPYVRIPDHFAAPVAQRDLQAQGPTCSVNQKYQRILAYVVADNPNVAIMKLVNTDQGWGFYYIRSSQAPIQRS